MNTHPKGHTQTGLRFAALGGSGLSPLLRGLKQFVGAKDNTTSSVFQSRALYITDLTAIVSVVKSGDSHGHLLCDSHMLPPGDLCSCMSALSKDHDLLSRVFRHHFYASEEFAGHSFGNIFITALAEMTGDFTEAIRLASEILSVRGRVLPVTTTDVALVARMEDGSALLGKIATSPSNQRIIEVKLDPLHVPASAGVLEAIASADVVIIGPGSLYSDLIANLLVDGVSDAMAATRATRIYISSLMTEPNESLGLTVSQHVKRIYQHAGRPIFDYALVNTGPVSKMLCKHDVAGGAEPVIADIEEIEALGIQCITGDFRDEGNTLRHSPEALTDALFALLKKRSTAAVANMHRQHSDRISTSASLPPRHNCHHDVTT
jgi:uncharacterized cofD-like protein